MKNLDEFLDELVLKDGKEPELTDEEQNRILTLALQKIKKDEHAVLNREKRKGRRITKVLLIAACIFIVGLSAALAAQHFSNWDEGLSKILNATPGQQEQLETLIDQPQATVTRSGFTVNVLQTLADSKSIYVVYEIIGPEDFVFTDKHHFRFEELIFEQSVEQYGGTGYTEKLEQSGNRRKMVYWFSLRNGLVRQQNIKLRLQDLQLYGSHGELDGTTLIADEWIVTWAFDPVDTSQEKVIYPNVKATAYTMSQQRDKTATITKIILTPLSITIEARVDDVVEIEDSMFDTGFTVNIKDGTEIERGKTGRNRHATASPENGFVGYYGFDNIINVEDVKSITIGETEIII